MVKELSAMHELRKRLSFSPVFQMFKGRRRCTLDINARIVQIKCLFLHEKLDDPANPVKYWTQSLAKAEQVYDTTQLKYFAVDWPVLKLQLYLDGTCFTTQTDHALLRWNLGHEYAICSLAR